MFTSRRTGSQNPPPLELPQPVQTSPQSWALVDARALYLSVTPGLWGLVVNCQPSLIAFAIKKNPRKIDSVPCAHAPPAVGGMGAVWALLPGVEGSLAPAPHGPACPAMALWCYPGPRHMRVGDLSKPCGRTEALLCAHRAVAQKLVYSCGQACLEVKSNLILSSFFFFPPPD